MSFDTFQAVEDLEQGNTLRLHRRPSGIGFLVTLLGPRGGVRAHFNLSDAQAKTLHRFLAAELSVLDAEAAQLASWGWT